MTQDMPPRSTESPPRRVLTDYAESYTPPVKPLTTRPVASQSSPASENQRIQARRMSERDLLDAVVECAQRFGWLSAHIPDALYTLAVTHRREDAMIGAKGFPDLVLGHPVDKSKPIIFAELKSERGSVRPEQQIWLDALDRESLDTGCVIAVVWRPSHWLSGEIERVLRCE